MLNPTPAQLEEILTRKPGMTNDLALLAVLRLVDTMTRLTVAEATGYYTPNTLTQQRNEAAARFVFEMESAEQETGP